MQKELFSQTDNLNFDYHKSLPAFAHTVEKGQTLYSISKKYNVTKSEIESFNDGLINGLQLQSTIYIPIKNQFILHYVEKGQTLFSIAKKYQTTKSKIIADNKLSDDNVKLGQSIKIFFDRSEATKTSDLKNTGNKALLQESKTVAIEDENELKNTNDIVNSKIVVALLLPLFLDKNFTEEEEGNISTDEKQPPVFTKSYAALDFYEGVKLACDSFVQNSKFEILTIDFPSDTFAVQNILLSKELKKANIIIGPFNSNYATFVADYCKKNKKIYCTPFGQQGKILLNNEYAFKASSSNTTQLENIAKYIAKKFNKSQCLVVHNGLKKEKNLVDAFKQKYNSVNNDSAKTILFKDSKLIGLKNKLSTTKENTIVVCSNDQAFVTDFVNKIYTLKDEYKITLFGTEQWQEYENLEVSIIQDLKLHIPSNYYIDYNDSLTKKFIKKFRTEFYTEPSRAAFLGFDLMQMIISRCDTNTAKIENLCSGNYKGLHVNFDFVKTSHESGYENTYAPIFKYEDFMLKAVEK